MSDSKVILLNMCMVYDDCDNYLVLDRTKPDWPGITFPGGHVEFNESLIDSVIREIKEETGLNIYNPRLCGIKNWIGDDGNRYVVILYKTDKFDGQLVSSREGNVFWVNKKDFGKLNWSSGMTDYLKIFLNDEFSEVYYYLENDVWKYRLQ